MSYNKEYNAFEDEKFLAELDALIATKQKDVKPLTEHDKKKYLALTKAYEELK
jgi:hypothetical protein